MFRKDSEELTGYSYPQPSIDRGQTRTPHLGTPVSLSKESVEKVRAVVREHEALPKGKKP